jgi:quercetin dioxygenase-like cupin family protein
MALHHARAGEVIDLRPLGDDLKHAGTKAIVKTDLFETVRLVVHEGMDIDEHDVDGPIMLHCLEGNVNLGLAGSNVSLRAGQWMYLEGGVRHSVRGIEESSLLLTILFKR